MDVVVLIDGKTVAFKATAAVPRLYRIKFRRDIIQDMQMVKKALEAKEANGENIPVEAVELFENMAYVMAKHAAPDTVPKTPEEWLDGFNAFSIYSIFPVIRALWDGNMESLVEAKKKLEQLSAK